MKPQKIECVICGEMFDTDIHNSKYCSEECRIDAKMFREDYILISKRRNQKKLFCWR